MRIIEHTSEKLTFQDNPRKYLIIISSAEAVIIFAWLLGPTPLPLYLLLIQLLIFVYSISRIRFINGCFDKKSNTFLLNYQNVFGQRLSIRKNISDTKNVCFLEHYYNQKPSFHKIFLITKNKDKIFLSHCGTHSFREVFEASISISQFLGLKLIQEKDKPKYKHRLLIFFILMLAPVVYLHTYPGKTLVDASIRGDILSVKRYLDGGGDPNVKNLLDDNALFFAADKGHKEIVRLLLENGAKVNVTCMNSTPLHQAVATKDLDIVKMLVEYGANINALTKDDEKTPLDYAMLGNVPHIASYLKQHGALYSVELIHRK